MKLGEAFRDKFAALREQLKEVPLPPPPPLPHVDEGQVAGELLEWLLEQGLLAAGVKRDDLATLLGGFFAGRDV